MQRLSKILASCGIASRRGCEKLIFAGRIKVNGEKVFSPQRRVDLNKDKILLDDKPIKEEEKKAYFILNKPLKYICSNKKEKHNKLVIDLFSEYDYRLFTVGRLDVMTTGLIFVTNDGNFANTIMHPSHEIEKEYLVKVKEEINHDHLKKLSSEIMIENMIIKPLRVEKIRKGTFTIVVKDGKKHEVRIITKNANLSILQLKRIRIGHIVLGNLKEGHFRKMTYKEIKSFKS